MTSAYLLRILLLYPPCPDEQADPVAQYIGEDGDWTAGVRPPNVIESVGDVAWLFDPNTREQTDKVRLTCRYCGENRAVRTQGEGDNWFSNHTCEGEGVPIEQWLAA